MESQLTRVPSAAYVPAPATRVRPSRFLVALVVVVLAAVTSLTSGASANKAATAGTVAVAASAPACPKGSIPPATGQHPACVHGPWATPFATPVDGTEQMSSSYVPSAVGGGDYSYWLYTVTIAYHNPLPDCPSPTPPSAAPCQLLGTEVAGYGRVVAGKTNLVPLPTGVFLSSADCSMSEPTCEMVIRANPHDFHGSLLGIFGVTVDDLTKDPKGNQGNAGFEFALPLSIPVPTG